MSEFKMIKCTKCKRDTPLLQEAKNCIFCGAALEIDSNTICEENSNHYNWLNEEERNHIPSVVNREYGSLIKLIEESDIYGSIFKLRDVFEIIMKVPTIMSLIVVCNNYDRKTATDEETKLYKEILAALLTGPLAMGSWQNLMAIIKKNGDKFCLGGSLRNILDQTNRCLNQKFREYDSVAQWRNETIGHGTLMIGNGDSYWDEVVALIEILNKYFRGEYKDKNQSELNNLYESVYFEFHGHKLQGINAPNELQGQHILWNEGREYIVSSFVHLDKEKYYFFDSYYSRKMKTKVTDYISHTKYWDKDDFYKGLYQLYETMVAQTGDVKLGSKYITEYEQHKLDCLNESIEYEKQEYIFEALRQKMSEKEKGVIILQMERGMGKSAFAYELNGAYKDEYYNDELDAVIRTFHLGELRYRNLGDFYISPINLFLTTATDKGNIMNPDDSEFSKYYDNLTNKKDIASSVAGLLEYFREMYNDLADADRDLRIIFVVDGIDELNNECKAIIHELPLEEELENGCYILLTSRFEDERSVSEATSALICDAVKRFGGEDNCLRFRKDNKKYLDTLRSYVKKLSDKIPSISKRYTKDEIDMLLEKAQNRFLYVRPLLELGENVAEQEIASGEVAKKYIERVSDIYYGVLHEIFELVLASIGVFRKISLEEICDLVLHEGVTYEAIGCINDLMPLLTTWRENGQDYYGLANEEYEKFVFDNMGDAVCEVIRRYRISMVSWFESTDKKADDYGKQWGNYIKRALLVDRVAKNIKFFETTEEYIKALIELCRGYPGSFYSRSVFNELYVDIIEQLRLTNYRDLELLSLKDLTGYIPLQSRWMEFREKGGLYWKKNEFTQQKKYEFTQEIIEHCVQKGTIDIWFEFVVSDKMGLNSEDEIDNDRLNAFRKIVEAWPNQEIVIDYLNQKIQDDLKENKNHTYGAYLEQLLSFVIGERLRKKIFVGLLNAYYLLAKEIIMFPRGNNVEEKRKEVMQKYLLEAETYTSLCNYSLIAEIKDAIFGENVYDKAIEQLNMLAETVYSKKPREYSDELYRLRLTERDLTEDQIRRYRQAQIKNYQSIINHIKKLLDEQRIDSVYDWLDVCWCEDINSFTVENEGLLIEYLSLYEKLVMVCVEEGNIKRLSNLELMFKRLLLQYDEKVRKKSIGLYRSVYWDIPVDQEQEMTSWERTYALYCSSLGDFDFCNMHDAIPIVSNDFTNKYLQDLYVNEEYEMYNELNCRIMETYENIEFRNNYILSGEYPQYRLIINYYRWLTVRYYRSVEGKDNLSSDFLYERLEEEYAALLNRVKELLSNESDLIHRISFSDVGKFIKDLLFLSKMIPDSICTVEDAKDEIVSMIDALVKTTSSNNEIKEIATRINNTISAPLEWFNKDVEFILDMTDKSLFE